MGKQWKQWETILGGSKISADDWSHEIKRHLLLIRKVMTNLDSILKSRDITLPTKVHLVKAIVFPVVIYGCESWTIKKAKHKRIDVFELWCWRRLLRVPWTARRSNQWILEEILEWIFIGRTDVEAETPILWPPDAKNWFIGKGPDAGNDWRQEEKGARVDEMVGWHHWCKRVWVISGSWWWRGKPGVLQSMGLQSHTQLSDWTELTGLQPTRLLCPWDFPGRNAEVGSHFLLQGIFPTKWLNSHLLILLHYRWIFHMVRHQGGPHGKYHGNQLVGGKQGRGMFWPTFAKDHYTAAWRIDEKGPRLKSEVN